jgi:hypothetical protein
MSDETPTIETSPRLKSELSKDELLKFIELDLWSRFQERLWKVVATVLTIATVIGLLGVPYYIKNEVSARLQQREKEFSDKTDEILAYSKLLAVLRSRYDSERYRFDSDALRAVAAISDLRKSESDAEKKARGFENPESELVALVSRQDFSQVTDTAYMSTRLFWVPGDLKSKAIVPPTMITVENKGPTGSGSYRQVHPVRDGSYRGVITDLRYRIVALESLRRSIDNVQEKMLSLGGTSELEKKVQIVRVNSLEATDFRTLFSAEVESITNTFLTSDEQREFTKYRELYVPDYKSSPIAPKSTSPGVPVGGKGAGRGQ